MPKTKFPQEVTERIAKALYDTKPMGPWPWEELTAQGKDPYMRQAATMLAAAGFHEEEFLMPEGKVFVRWVASTDWVEVDR